MIFERFEVPGLSQYSYAVGAGDSLAIIDPKRDVDTYVNYAQRNGLRISYVLETHIHADFASGAKALAAQSGAKLCLSSYTDGERFSYRFAHCSLRDGDELPLDELTLKVLHTPGHTPEHISFLLLEPGRSHVPIALFSGDFLFVGSVGRPDLLGEGEKKKLAKALYKSMQRIRELPDGTEVFPGHGAGSLCGTAISHRNQSTLGYERVSNPFFREQTEAEFTEIVLSTVPELPDYYRRMKELNSNGADPVHTLAEQEAFSPDLFEKRRDETHAIVVDLRSQEAYGGASIPNSFNIGAGPNLSMWSAWLLPHDRPILLVGDAQSDLDEARRSFLRIGLDQVCGSLRGGIRSWIEEGKDQAHIPQSSVRELKQLLQNEKAPFLLDVRSPSEWRSGRISGSINIPLGELQKRLNELPTEEVLYVICGSGYRSSIATSILARTGRRKPINVNGGMTAWRNQGFPEVR
jgi:hydroxyacylglutathione hydrolase